MRKTATGPLTFTLRPPPSYQLLSCFSFHVTYLPGRTRGEYVSGGCRSASGAPQDRWCPPVWKGPGPGEGLIDHRDALYSSIH
ncbi:hypothetical protein AVEN_105030-1 [Araneus ventricosus]|uniref:Uncharacterized protein n=1 Tax=Araneus ventricosus TaxID=182803 RepID=A0A4Y2GFQ0_ARAVE|nr:hypothetical protein AVEN_105030-1 [Araneus ventricosus]